MNLKRKEDKGEKKSQFNALIQKNLHIVKNKF